MMVYKSVLSQVKCMCPLREERHWTIVCGSSLVEYRCQQRYTPTTCYEMDLDYSVCTHLYPRPTRREKMGVETVT